MKSARNLLSLALALFLGAAMLSAVRSWPEAALAGAPLRMHVSPRYVEKCAQESGRATPAAAARWDYRSWDLWFWVFACAAALAAAARRGQFKGMKWAVGCAASAALLLGILPVFNGGVFLDYEALPALGSLDHLRFFGTVALESAFFLSLAMLLFGALSSDGDPEEGAP